MPHEPISKNSELSGPLTSKLCAIRAEGKELLSIWSLLNFKTGQCQPGTRFHTGARRGFFSSSTKSNTYGASIYGSPQIPKGPPRKSQGPPKVFFMPFLPILSESERCFSLCPAGAEEKNTWRAKNLRDRGPRGAIFGENRSMNASEKNTRIGGDSRLLRFACFSQGHRSEIGARRVFFTEPFMARQKNLSHRWLGKKNPPGAPISDRAPAFFYRPMKWVGKKIPLGTDRRSVPLRNERRPGPPHEFHKWIGEGVPFVPHKFSGICAGPFTKIPPGIKSKKAFFYFWIDYISVFILELSKTNLPGPGLRSVPLIKIDGNKGDSKSELGTKILNRPPKIACRATRFFHRAIYSCPPKIARHLRETGSGKNSPRGPRGLSGPPFRDGGPGAFRVTYQDSNQKQFPRALISDWDPYQFRKNFINKKILKQLFCKTLTPEIKFHRPGNKIVSGKPNVQIFPPRLRYVSGNQGFNSRYELIANEIFIGAPILNLFYSPTIELGRSLVSGTKDRRSLSFRQNKDRYFSRPMNGSGKIRRRSFFALLSDSFGIGKDGRPLRFLRNLRGPRE